MADTFSQMWRRILLHCPFVPVPLAQDWINDRYRLALDQAGLWGGQVAESQFIIPDAYSTGTISAINGSATVTGAATGWTTALEGRQFYVGGQGPFYTITTVDAGAQTLTLERPFGGATTGAGTAYEIAQVYVTAPADFLAFKTIKDPVNNWRIRFNKSQEWLDRIDAARTTVGNAWYFVDYRQSTATGSVGVPRYEVWPRVTNQKVYPFLYWRRPADFSADTDTPMFPLRGDELVTGALADLARWPGTESRRNPNFDLRLAKDYEQMFEDMVRRLQRVDQETYLSDYIAPGDGFDEGLSDIPLSASWIQQHDL